MKLTEQQKIAVRLLVGGVSQAEIARRLEVNEQTVYSWTRKRIFQEEIEFQRSRRDALLDQRMESLLSLIDDRLRDILLDGKDADSLGAIDRVLRYFGKYEDKVTVTSRSIETREDAYEYASDIARSYNIHIDLGPYGIVQPDGSIKRPRSIISSGSGSREERGTAETVAQ
jgi:AcrR family transcriptional regulator